MSVHVCACCVCICPDIDECQSPSTCANGICLNSEGSYTCENCPTGYRVSYDGELCDGEFNSTKLSLINSCITAHVYRIQSERTNVGRVIGSLLLGFFLVCRDLHWISNRLCCFTPDIDECALPTTCPQGTCTNTPGSYTCIICQPGFRVSEDGQQCDGEVFLCVCAGMCFCYVCILQHRCV